jgi:uncharacterized protein YjbI with pentapeptide repeats
MDEDIKKLKEENLRLKKELEKLKSITNKKSKTKKGVLKFVGITFAGRRLKQSIYKVLDQYNKERYITREALSDLLASIVYRLTRIGLFTLIFALLPFVLLIQQNLLLKQQNKKIQDQNYLAEASRRSTQMFIMGDVLSDLNQELNNGNRLSSSLVGRIASLSLAMKPYHYFKNGKLIEDPMSPERGQLLLTISKSVFNRSQLSDEIFQESDFTYAELGNVMLRSAHLKDIVLDHANLKYADLDGANLINASFAYANLNLTDFSDADLRFADFSHANLNGSYLLNTKLKNTNFFKTQMDSVKVDRMDWLNYIKDELKLRGAELLYKTYIVDSVYDSVLDKKIPTLLKK